MKHQLKYVGRSHEAYLKDSPDFLKHTEEKNWHENLPDNAMIVVIDVIGLYDNIPSLEGVKSVEECLGENSRFKVPPRFISRLLPIIPNYLFF